MLQLQIETTNCCNARCLFCHYPQMERTRGFMPMDLFRRIIKDAATVPQIEKVTIAGLGEPLLDEHLLERLKYIRREMQIGCLDLYTNGSGLTLDLIRKLNAAEVSVLYVSLNAVDRERRKEVMGLDDYDDIAAVLDDAINTADRCAMKIIVKGIAGKDLFEPCESEYFTNRWHGSVDKGGNAFMHLEGNWAGKTYPVRLIPRQACMRALQQIMVLWDGRVALCCFDGNGDVILGDLSRQTIRDIYNNGTALRYREMHAAGKRKELPLCGGCTMI